MQTVTFDGAEVSYEDVGEGPPLLLVHSSGMGAQQFGRWLGPLSAGRRVLAPDLPGYGESTPIPAAEPFEVGWDVEALVRVCEAAGVGSTAVFGHSFGGVVALELALAEPSLVSALVLYEPVAFGVLAAKGERTLEDDLGGARFVDTFMDRGEGLAAWLERFIGYWNGQGAWGRLSPGARAMFERNAERAWAEVDAMVRDGGLQGGYEGLEVPTLLLRGDATTPAAARVTDVLARTMEAARVEVIDGAGHMGPLTHQSRVLACIECFIGR